MQYQNLYIALQLIYYINNLMYYFIYFKEKWFPFYVEKQF